MIIIIILISSTDLKRVNLSLLLRVVIANMKVGSGEL